MEGETNAITGSTSNLPIIMHKAIVTLLKLENCEKFPKGPISSNPEPILLMDAKAAENVVMKSKLSNDSITIETNNMNI
jgi:hypothetical protein